MVGNTEGFRLLSIVYHPTTHQTWKICASSELKGRYPANFRYTTVSNFVLPGKVIYNRISGKKGVSVIGTIYYLLSQKIITYFFMSKKIYPIILPRNCRFNRRNIPILSKTAYPCIFPKLSIWGKKSINAYWRKLTLFDENRNVLYFENGNSHLQFRKYQFLLNKS